MESCVALAPAVVVVKMVVRAALSVDVRLPDAHLAKKNAGRRVICLSANRVPIPFELRLRLTR